MTKLLYFLLILLPFTGHCQSMDICYDSPIPSGWIKVNDYYNPTSCGNPRQISYNVYQIRKYDELPKNSILEVCYDATMPAGWVINSKKWDPTRCGHFNQNSNNIFIIIKIN